MPKIGSRAKFQVSRTNSCRDSRSHLYVRGSKREIFAGRIGDFVVNGDILLAVYMRPVVNGDILLAVYMRPVVNGDIWLAVYM